MLKVITFLHGLRSGNTRLVNYRCFQNFVRCFLELTVLSLAIIRNLSVTHDLTKDRKLGMSICTVVMYGVQLMR